MPLVKLQDGPSQWKDIEDAAGILWRSTLTPDISAVATALQDHYQNPNLIVSELKTGFNVSRRAVVVCNSEKITIAFLGSDPKELHKNWWINAKGPAFWDWPYPVYENGNRIHSFFRDMWYGVRLATYGALSSAVEDMAARGATPKQIIVTGFSMGGGISIIAFTDILERIRCTRGLQSGSPQSWAQDKELGSLVQHLTFAAVPAGDQGYYTVLNQLYETHQIRAWIFLNHRDRTVLIHPFQFRSWRGYQYILPDAVVRFFGNEFSANGHCILGYMKAAEWMAENGTDQLSIVVGAWADRAVLS
ncbi:hypothetical protein P154DRAFT_559300 [Amniculicola lignicola CBS 123094]|uniref:Fungal lipase-type domain-containing protein n=1 Tax=Amniculicola lignicola CBS 123094 TaxID=1392246 RepID=A0A6A5X1Y4_9PLEO|nr:hypothetical protein P154DRAFT_559300 [Amniculicola lignicola CBS 123094]